MKGLTERGHMERVWEESDSLPSRIHFKSHQGHGLPLSWHFRQAVCVVALCLGDILSVSLAVGLGYMESQLLKTIVPMERLLMIEWAQGGLYLFFFLAFGFLIRGLYSRREPFWDQVRLTLKAILVSVMVAVLALYFTKLGEITPRSLVLLSACNLFLICPFLRLLAIWALNRYGLWCRRVVLVGDSDACRSMKVDLEKDFALGYRVIDIRSFEKSDTVDLMLRAETGGIDEIVVVQNGTDQAVLSRFVASAHRAAPSVTLVPELGFLPFGSGSSQFLFESGRILLNSRNMLHARGNLLVKRAFDLCASLVLTIIVLPLLGVISLAIRLDSRGSAIYRQVRVGRRGRLFGCLKFRTMYPDAERRLEELLASDPSKREEWDRHCKLEVDPRITRMGHFLRKWSLDELPQLFNVIAGSMSLVGPRPLPEYHHDRIAEPHRSDYLDVTPGITGLWQVSGRSDSDVGRMGLLNSWYVRNWSLWIDITLLLRTIPVVLGRRGAY